jgi:ATP-dependent Clp protease ATP-binding subunit ClpA
MTSNIGAEVKNDGLGFCPSDRAGQTEKLLRQHFTPEFLGRLDKIIHFVPLADHTKATIAEKYLRQLQKRSCENGIQLSWDNELLQHLVSQKEGGGGARHLRRLVQDRVEGPLALHLLGLDKTPGKISIRVDADQVHFS